LEASFVADQDDFDAVFAGGHHAAGDVGAGEMVAPHGVQSDAHIVVPTVKWKLARVAGSGEQPELIP
jgi:hypothetical protein